MSVTVVLLLEVHLITYLEGNFFVSAINFAAYGSLAQCPEGFVSAASSKILTEGGIVATRCFRALKEKFASFYEVLPICKNSFEEKGR